jgi:hypothetical protein
MRSEDCIDPAGGVAAIPDERTAHVGVPTECDAVH